MARLYKTVKPSGGDYTTLQACLDANKKDLRAGTGSDEYFDIEIDGSWSSADTTAATTTGYTTDSTHYINIYTTATARHNGRSAAASGGTNYRLVVAVTALTVTVSDLIVDGLEISSRGSAYADCRGIFANGDAITGGCIIKNNVVHDCYDTGYYAIGVGIYMHRGGLVYNNIVYNCGAQGLSSGGDYGANISFYNNTIYNYNLRNGSYPGLIVVGANNSTTNVKNNLVIAGANGGACFSIGSGTSSNNGGSDTSGDTDNLTTSEFVSVTGGSENLHLATGATSIDAGTSLSGVFTVDIDGTTRSGTWDIGADEYASAATGQPLSKRLGGIPFARQSSAGISRW